MNKKEDLDLGSIKIDVPPQLRGPIEPELNKTSERIDKFIRDIRQAVILICDGNEKAGQVWMNDKKLKFSVEYGNFERSNDYVVEITWNDRLLGLVHVRRTQFNHQEETFFLHKETFFQVKKDWEEWKERGA